jgi:hypothetical protein
VCGVTAFESPVTARDRAARLLALRVIKDWITAEDRRLREEAAAELLVGETVKGLADPADKGSVLGFVQLTKARESWSVTDPDALLEWVEAVAPTEVVTTRQVRPAFIAAVLADCKSHGTWISPDGELLAPDGVEVRTGSPTLMVKPTAEADYLVADALAARRLELGPGWDVS